MKRLWKSLPALAAALATAFAVLTTPAQARTPAPTVTLPAPSGRYPVGFEELHLVDRSRPDPWVPESGPRELLVSMWYPTVAPGGNPKQYLSVAESRALLDLHGVTLAPAALAGVRGADRTHAPIRPALRGYPLVVLSPGFSLPVATLTSLAQDLASRGYVVAGIDHPYESAGLDLPGGRFASCVACETASPAQVPPIRARDVSFVLDHLTRRPSGWRGARWIDRSRIGMAGHSIGGNASLEAMRADRRIDAGINLDGTFFTPPPSQGMNRPFLILGTPAHAPGGDDSSWDRAWPLFTGWRRWFVADGTGHLSFTDFPVLAERFNLPKDPNAPLDGDRTDELTRALIRDFFAHHLGRQPATALLDGTDPAYPELRRQYPTP